MPKDASLEQTNFMTQKASLLDKEDCSQSIYYCGQTSGGMGASQSTAYKSEFNVKWLVNAMNLLMFMPQNQT
jgi:HAE1 family hydrophobic/amphiphilic exporter-1